MLPTLFVSHGSPTLLIDDCAAHDFLAGLGAQFERPRAILCVSAHWEARRPTLSAASLPETIHDFSGFPEQLFQARYDAPGSPEVAREAEALLAGSGLDVEISPDRGLDHGVWVPLALMYPDAGIPVLQLSIQSANDAEHHRRLGEVLRPLRERGVLIMGSGGATHNLRELNWRDIGAAPHAHVAAFESWLVDAVSGGKSDELVGWASRAPDPRRIHPTVEHFLPLFVPLGAASAPEGRALHRSFTFAALSMAAFAWR
jgi:4,5-DOPA dioxygenase extradiol